MGAIETDNNAKRLDLIERTRRLLAHLEQGCTNHVCKMTPPTPGLHTNGTCGCWTHMADDFLACAAIIEEMPRYKRCWTCEPNERTRQGES